MRKQTKRWPGHIAERSSSRAVPHRAVLCCRGWRALANLQDAMAMAAHVGSAGETHAPVGRRAAWWACGEKPRGHQPPRRPCSVPLPGSRPGAASLPTCMMAHVVWRSGGTAHVPHTAGPPRSPEVQKHVLEEGWCCLVT